MKTLTSFKTALFGGLVVATLAITGCRTPPILIIRSYNKISQYSPTNADPKKSKKVIIYSNTPKQTFSFDQALEKARDIPSKPEPKLIDDWKTPEQTKKYGGDCEDKAIYFSNKLTEQRIPHKVVTGLFDASDILDGHVWNRVFENKEAFLVDPSSGMKLREDEVPDDFYREFYSFTPTGYSESDIQKYKCQAYARTTCGFVKSLFCKPKIKKPKNGKK